LTTWFAWSSVYRRSGHCYRTLLSFQALAQPLFTSFVCHRTSICSLLSWPKMDVANSSGW
jgi:hypothetical protein